MEWRPARWSVCLPLLIFPCTIMSRSSLLALAQLGGPEKRAVKWLWLIHNLCFYGVFPQESRLVSSTLVTFQNMFKKRTCEDLVAEVSTDWPLFLSRDREKAQKKSTSRSLTTETKNSNCLKCVTLVSIDGLYHTPGTGSLGQKFWWVGLGHLLWVVVSALQ